MTETNGHAPLEKMLTPQALADLLGISPRHLTDLRREMPGFPQPKMLGTSPRWSPRAVNRWMDDDTSSATEVVTPTAPERPAAKRTGGSRVF